MAKSNNLLRVVFVIFALLILSVFIIIVPNSLGSYILGEAKANGYLEYEPMEAHALANKICTQCHTTERIKKYCPRCGPPFVAVVPHMQSFIDNYKITRPELKVINITEYQAVAIVQVWNAVIGNWEGDFREQDILKLIGQYDLLAKLYKTPVEDRKIERALSLQEDLKIGAMKGMAGMQENLGKPGNNPCAPETEMTKMQENPAKPVNPCAPQGHDHSSHKH